MDQELKHQIKELQGSIEDIYNKLSRELIKCPDCDGSGRINKTERYEDIGLAMCLIDCVACNGKGKVWVSSNYFNIYEEEKQSNANSICGRGAKSAKSGGSNWRGQVY